MLTSLRRSGTLTLRLREKQVFFVNVSLDGDFLKGEGFRALPGSGTDFRSPWELARATGVSTGSASKSNCLRLKHRAGDDALCITTIEEICGSTPAAFSIQPCSSYTGLERYFIKELFGRCALI